MSSPIDKFLAALPGRYKSAGHRKWKAACPAHGSDNPTTLSIAEGENGAVLLKCHAHDCSVAEIASAVGLQLSDLFLPKDRTSRGSSVAQRNFTRQPGEKPAATGAAEPTPTTPGLFTLTKYGKVQRKPIDWLIHGYLVSDTLAGIIAPPGTCKSFVGIDWACRVVSGTPWRGRRVKQGVVFYLAGEGQSGLSRRIAGWEAHHGIDLKDAPLMLASNLPFLCDADNLAATVAILEEAADQLFFECGQEPALIVVDTVARAMNGANENSTEDMGRFIAAIDTLRLKWGATVLTVHHTGNNPSAQDRGRGSSNYGASLDSDFYLTASGSDIHLRAGTKAKDWPTPMPVVLTRVVVQVDTLDEDGNPETTLVLVDTGRQVLDKDEDLKRGRVFELAEQGLSQRDIAQQTDVPKTTVQRWLKDSKRAA